MNTAMSEARGTHNRACAAGPRTLRVRSIHEASAAPNDRRVPAVARMLRPGTGRGLAFGRSSEIDSSGPACTSERAKAKRRACAGWSALELLVAISVVALLAALLLPVLARARTRGRSITCVNNLRQLGIACQMYWHDHDDAAFRFRGDAFNQGDFFWFGWLERGAEGSRRFDPAAGPLHPYLAGRGVTLCPAFDYALPAYKRKARGASYGYGYNLCFSSPAGEPAFRVNRVRQPAQTALLADAAQVNTFQPPASPERPMLEEFYYINDTEATTHFRHDRRVWVVFADGHVAAMPVSQPIDGRIRDQVLSRLPRANVRID